MAKLHELLAAEKVPSGAWNTLLVETQKKFNAQTHYFEGHSKSLKMIEDSDANRVTEADAREEKPVTTTVKDTLEYALRIWGKAEDVQAQKNATNAVSHADVMWNGSVLLAGVPIDTLLGLESRLIKIRDLFTSIPTVDATKNWEYNGTHGENVWTATFPEESVKTEKVRYPVILHEGNEHHPPVVESVAKDIVVGRFATVRRSGSATAGQKAEMLERIDDLLVAVKEARMRANNTDVVDAHVASEIIGVLMEPLNNGS